MSRHLKDKQFTAGLTTLIYTFSTHITHMVLSVLTGCLKGCGVVLGGVSMLDCLAEAKLALRDWSMKGKVSNKSSKDSVLNNERNGDDSNLQQTQGNNLKTMF